MTKPTEMGFTLIELMVTITVAAILLGLAVPSFRSMIQNNTAATQANDFLSALSLTRSEAIKRGTTVRITALNAADTANEWGKGWQVWVDSNNNNAYNAGEEIRITPALSSGGTLNSVDNISELQYASSGFLSITAGTTRTFQLRVPNCTGNQGRNITVSPTGRAAVTRVACP